MLMARKANKIEPADLMVGVLQLHQYALYTSVPITNFNLSFGMKVLWGCQRGLIGFHSAADFHR